MYTCWGVMLFVILDLGCVCFLGIVSGRRYDGPFVFVGRAHTHTHTVGSWLDDS